LSDIVLLLSFLKCLTYHFKCSFLFFQSVRFSSSKRSYSFFIFWCETTPIFSFSCPSYACSASSRPSALFIFFLMVILFSSPSQLT
jgi:hypothetical protein